jgi:hypothetical protein
MWRLTAASILVLASCRPKASPPQPLGDSQPPLVESSVPARTTTQLAPPLSAVRVQGATVVAARVRGEQSWALSRYFDTAPTDPEVTTLGPLPDESELVASSADVGLVSRQPLEGSSRRVLRRLGGSDDGGPPIGELTPVGDAVCGTLDGIYWLQRTGSGFQTWRRALGGGAPEAVAGPVLTSQTEATLVCSEHRTFLATNAEGQVRVVAWSSEERDASTALHPVTLPKPPLAGAPDDVVMSATGDGLALVALDAKSIAIMLYRPEQPISQWHVTKLPSEGMSLEAVEPEANKIGLLLLHSVPPAKECRKDDANDTVAELAIFDIDAGKLTHPPERVETWRCGAEPGPFFSGWASGKFVVGWPRGADAACARARVRWGGLGFAVVDPGGARVRVEHAGSPADTIVEAGCSKEKCYAVALTRGAEPCGPADGPGAGKAEIVAYP